MVKLVYANSNLQMTNVGLIRHVQKQMTGTAGRASTAGSMDPGSSLGQVTPKTLTVRAVFASLGAQH